MKLMSSRLIAALAIMVAANSFAVFTARAGTVIDDWASIKAPPPPELKAVTIDPKTTALLLLDFVHPICSEQTKPRCVASLPAIKKLLDEARTNHVMVVYSTAGHDDRQGYLGGYRADAGRAGRQLPPR